MNISGLHAAQIGLQGSAHNVANAATPGFEPSRVIYQATHPEGVRPHVEHPRSGGRRDPDGEPPPSDTDMSEEAVNQISLKTMYTANVKALQTQSEMLGMLVDIKA
jgi:flagellar hook protein FlgE